MSQDYSIEVFDLGNGLLQSITTTPTGEQHRHTYHRETRTLPYSCAELRLLISDDSEFDMLIRLSQSEIAEYMQRRQDSFFVKKELAL